MAAACAAIVVPPFKRVWIALSVEWRDAEAVAAVEAVAPTSEP